MNKHNMFANTHYPERLSINIGLTHSGPIFQRDFDCRRLFDRIEHIHPRITEIFENDDELVENLVKF